MPVAFGDGLCVLPWFMDLSFLTGLRACLAQITSGVCRAVAACVGGSGRPQILPADMIVLVWQRVKTAETRLLALMERVRLGRQRLSVVRAARAVVGRADGEPAGRVVVALPRRFGWLVAMVGPTAAVRGSQLAHLLDDPEMVALVRDVPQARRLLAPLCRMLGVEKCGVLAVRPVVPRVARVRRIRAAGEAVLVPAMARPGYVPSARWPRAVGLRATSRLLRG
jgi:hypothetical protein